MLRILNSILILGCALFFVGSTQDGVEQKIKRIEQSLQPPVLVKGDATWTIAERMKNYKVPAVSIAVVNNFKVEWARAYGVKDVETNEPATIETLFQAASISKPVAAMTALKKVQDGKIALEDDINKKLVSWKLPDNEFTATKKVTLANLLSHTGGLTVHGFPGYEVGDKIPTPQQVLDGAPPANTAPVRVDIPPGSRFRYSGGGITIAQLAIMDIEKKPYPEIANETVLGPLGMTNSTYSQPLPDDWRKKAASGHRPGGNTVVGKIHVYPEMAAAGLWTTPTDLAKFAIEVQLSLVGKSNKVLTQDTVTKMVTPYSNDSVGMGFMVDKRANSIYFGHGGANEGFRCQLLVHKTKGYGAAVMVNSDNGQIIEEIFRAIATEYNWDDFATTRYELVSLPASKLSEYAGRYQINADQVATFSTEGSRIFGQVTFGSKFEIFPVAESTFIRKDRDQPFAFQKDSAGKVTSIKTKINGRDSEVPRMSEGAMIPYELLISGKTTEAMDAYRKIKTSTPQDGAVEEGRLNGLGYSLMTQKKLSEAIAMFKLNTEFYPKSANVYDSLAEAYEANGDKELAIRNYKKSLELNPKNDGAVQALRKLEAK